MAMTAEAWQQMLAGASPEAKSLLRELGPDFVSPTVKARLASIDSCSSDSEDEPPALPSASGGGDGGGGNAASAGAAIAAAGAAASGGGASLSKVDSLVQAQARIVDPPLPVQSLLHELIGINRLDKVNKQLKKGANVNNVDSMGETPLFWAISPEAVDLLVSNGADPLWRNNVCDTSAFYKFACQGKYKPLRALAKHLYQVGMMDEMLDDAASHTQRTPLHAAACNGFTETVKELMAMGADSLLKDYLGKTALDLARQRGFDDIVDLLE